MISILAAPKFHKKLKAKDVLNYEKNQKLFVPLALQQIMTILCGELCNLA